MFQASGSSALEKKRNVGLCIFPLNKMFFNVRKFSSIVIILVQEPNFCGILARVSGKYLTVTDELQLDLVVATFSYVSFVLITGNRLNIFRRKSCMEPCFWFLDANTRWRRFFAITPWRKPRWMTEDVIYLVSVRGNVVHSGPPTRWSDVVYETVTWGSKLREKTNKQTCGRNLF